MVRPRPPIKAATFPTALPAFTQSTGAIAPVITVYGDGFFQSSSHVFAKQVLSGNIIPLPAPTTSKTSRWQTDARRCHINWVILDSDWEAEFCRVAESHPRVKAYVKNRIAPYSYPRWVAFVRDLPKTATGKIQRYKLRG